MNDIPCFFPLSLACSLSLPLPVFPSSEKREAATGGTVECEEKKGRLKCRKCEKQKVRVRSKGHSCHFLDSPGISLHNQVNRWF